MPSLRISWSEPSTGERIEKILPFPATIGSAPTSHVVLSGSGIAPQHATIRLETLGMVVDGLGVRVEGKIVQRALLTSGTAIGVGPYTLVAALDPSDVAKPAMTGVLALPDGRERERVEAPAQTGEWPPACFRERNVAVAAISAAGVPITTSDYATIGAGLGSFAWVQALLLAGVRAPQIAALGIDASPHARYRRLCLTSQIPDHERLRSNTDATPDNPWGFPGYALREVLGDVARLRLFHAARIAFQVLGEPALAETYTPIASDVYASIEREAERLAWRTIHRPARIRAIRLTDDGRYAIAYSGLEGGGARGHAIHLARHLHLATGYPALQFLPDLQRYREQTGDFVSVVNAYESHDHVYEHLRTRGGVVLLRGRGIVASRLLQRIHEVRRENRAIQVVHLVRTPLDRGHRYGLAKRTVASHFELQPFNWPKACFGGDLRKKLARASPEARKRLLADWGGTTTADRGDWRKILATGLRDGWYRTVFGEVDRVEKLPTGMVVAVVRTKGGGETRVEGTFAIDATGLDAKVGANPLLADLVRHYGLALNPLERLTVTNDFEIEGLRNGPARAFAAGSMTLGGPYAPVDSFVGLQFAARCSVDALRRVRAPGVGGFGPIRSTTQWLRWLVGAPP